MLNVFVDMGWMAGSTLLLSSSLNKQTLHLFLSSLQMSSLVCINPLSTNHSFEIGLQCCLYLTHAVVTAASLHFLFNLISLCLP